MKILLPSSVQFSSDRPIEGTKKARWVNSLFKKNLRGISDH
jgi:hypothetical protein